MVASLVVSKAVRSAETMVVCWVARTVDSLEKQRAGMWAVARAELTAASKVGCSVVWLVDLKAVCWAAWTADLSEMLRAGWWAAQSADR